jgi:hypothetical protein
VSANKIFDCSTSCNDCRQYVQLRARQQGTAAEADLDHTDIGMSLPPGYSIIEADSDENLQSFAQLALDYSRWLGVDLCFQVCMTAVSSKTSCSISGSCLGTA